jgi:GNAT superfamily N-acetyltransferase
MFIAACDPDDPAALPLLEELSAALAAITGDSGKASFAAADTRVPRSTFVVARSTEGELLGCGALRPLDGDIGEIKRMYARPGTSGVGAALLAHLEQTAQEFGYLSLWLETRKVNARAVSFYEHYGYASIPSYGKYIGRPEAICLGKTLTPV